MGDHWPWEARELDPQYHSIRVPSHDTGQVSGFLKHPLLGIPVSPIKKKILHLSGGPNLCRTKVLK
jgi:hypothetical protein